jgi:hypothetical protein
LVVKQINYRCVEGKGNSSGTQQVTYLLVQQNSQ